MQVDLPQAVGLGLAEDAVKMLEHPVHAGVAHDAEQVQLCTRTTRAFHHSAPDRVGREPALGEKLVEAHQLLVDHAAGADVLVPDLAVAHHAVGQADIQTRGADQGARAAGAERVVARLARLRHGVGGVEGTVGVLTPAIADNKEDGRTRGGHGVKEKPCTAARSDKRQFSAREPRRDGRRPAV